MMSGAVIWPSGAMRTILVSVVTQTCPLVGLMAMAMALIGKGGSSRPSGVKRRTSERKPTTQAVPVFGSQAT
ncbi:hypothetical protein ACYOEI_22255, partial [Singulisphaera rosea]